MDMLLLILSLPTENAAARMRAWRALKASGAAVLRDGVYLMPEQTVCRTALDAIAADVVSSEVLTCCVLSLPMTRTFVRCSLVRKITRRS
jgi:DNA-binding transcriptional regulator PaaX